MNTKIDIIDGAYSRMRISGITKIPSPEDTTLALRRLEMLAAQYRDPNYAFEDNPAPDTPHNLPMAVWITFETNLAVDLIPDFNKNAHPELYKIAMGSKAFYDGFMANTQQIQNPTRMPIGSGNSLRYSRYRRFFGPFESAPNVPETKRYLVNDVDILTEHYDSYLVDAEDVSTYTITSSDPTKLVVSADSLTSPDLTYTVTCPNAGVFKVTIKITTTLNRILSRVVNFVVTEP